MVTCLAPGPGKAVSIISVACFASGATATSVSATNNAASRTIFSIGGVGTGLLDSVSYLGGASGDVNDATKVTLTATGASASECTVVYQFVPA